MSSWFILLSSCSPSSRSDALASSSSRRTADSAYGTRAWDCTYALTRRVIAFDDWMSYGDLGGKRVGEGGNDDDDNDDDDEKASL